MGDAFFARSEGTDGCVEDGVLDHGDEGEDKVPDQEFLEPGLVRYLGDVVVG